MAELFTIRPVRDKDGPGVIALIAAAYADYPGCILDIDAECPDLRAPASGVKARGGAFWVAEKDGQVVGCVGYRPKEDAVELIRLFVGHSARRQGLGARLVGLVEATARELGAARILLWTDTRFSDAHRLYERLGYGRGAMPRALNDISHTVEFHYRKALVGSSR